MRLTIHAGLHKTGSTSIQVFCSHQKQCLQSANCFYPNELNYNGAHHLFAAALAQEDFGLLRDNIHRWHTECKKLGWENIIVSSEDLEYATCGQLLGLKSITDALSMDLRAIIYIRPQAELVISQYSQQVREGFCIQPFDEFMQDSLLQANYLRLERTLDNFAAVLGKGLEVCTYYSASHLPINAVDDFASRMNINNVNRYTDSSTYSFNPRLNCGQLEFIRKIVSRLPEINDLSQRDKSQVLYKFIKDYQWPDSLLRSKKLELALQELSQFMHFFYEENCRISDKYLSSSDILNNWYRNAIEIKSSFQSTPSFQDYFILSGHEELTHQAKDMILDIIRRVN